MSLVDALGSQVRSTAAELPLAEITAVLHRLRAAAALLRGVPGDASRPVGLARLAHATEHAEHAGHALRVAQDTMAEYLSAIGLTAGGPPDRPPERPAAGPPRTGPGRPAPPVRRPARRTESWWTRRVDTLVAAGQDDPPTSAAPATTSMDLLSTVLERVRARDRAGLRRHLRSAPVPVGLGLSALAAGALREVADRDLGHPAGPADLPGLRRRAAATVRDLLPGADPRIAEVLLARACRVPPSSVDFPAPHPADAAVTGAVLLGALGGPDHAAHGTWPPRRPPERGSRHA